MSSSTPCLPAKPRPCMSALATAQSIHTGTSHDRRWRICSAERPLLSPARAKNGNWCTVMIRQMVSRISNGTPARHSRMRASMAPRRECPG
ncbi:hypothetical protein D3C84_972250 [compost metagenome]